jgi:rhamnosyltransferase
MTTVGVVIRTLNESELLGTCLDALRAQGGPFDLDVLVVDSGSTDATVEIARSHGARVVEMAPQDFDYSRALNLGIAEARGDIVVSLSAHAVPVEDSWLERIVAVFDDPKVAGVSTRQVPWPGAPWQEVKRLQEGFDGTRRAYEPGSEEDILFSNAASAVRREAWLEHPFTLPAVEDVDWARRVVAAGWSIVYEPRTAVYHSHRETPREQARRMIDINRVHANVAERTWRRTLHEAAAFFRRDARSILGLEEPIRRRLAYLGELSATVVYYIVDFSKTGSTAERRRTDTRG